MINVAVLDDDRMDRVRIGEAVQTAFREKEERYSISMYENAMELLADLDQGKYYHLYLLDYELPLKTGIEVAREIRSYYPDPVIIFITNYIEHSLEAYEVDAYRYIAKGLLETKLPEALMNVWDRLVAADRNCYVIQRYQDMQVILHRDIYYLKKEGKYVMIHHKYGVSRDRKPLQTILETLNSEDFVEAARGYVVNVQHVMSIKKNEIHLRNGMVLPLSRSRCEAVKERILEIWK